MTCSNPRDRAERVLSRAEAREDLEALGRAVAANSAYQRVNGFRFQEHVDSAARALPDSVGIRAFWRIVQTAVGRIQDGHSNVRLPEGETPWPPGERLPFRLTTAADTIVAVARDGDSLFLRGFATVVAINGVPVDSLMRVAGIRFVGHSRQRYTYRALAALDPIEGILRFIGALGDGTLTVQLRSPRADTTVRVATVAPREARQLPPAAEMGMAGDVAVLTVRRMTESGDSIVRAAVRTPAFRGSRAVLIDVRGNDGGTRDVLETIVPLLIDRPLVYNIAVVRGDTNGVGDRGLAHPSDPSLPEPARVALRRALDAFRPSWDYTIDAFLPDRFGAVLMPADSSLRITGRPVAVLMDERSFSSTDIFLGAMRLVPSVTLMGTTSGGGSGRSRDFILPRSGLVVVLSTMASFQPNGDLYDGVGVAPAVVLERTIEGLASGTDTQKAAALAFLRSRSS